MASKEVTNTLGAVLISTLASFFLCGVVITGVHSYYRAFPNDRWYLQTVVGISFVLSLADTAVDGALAYKWLVSSYGQPDALEVMPREFVAMLAILGFVPFVVQGFFAWRLWKISSGIVSRRYNWILPSIIAVLTTAQLVVVLYNVHVWAKGWLLSDMASALFPQTYAWIAFLTAGDLLISFSMIYYLVIVPKRTLDVPKESQSRFMAIARRTLETNLLTLICQIILVVLETTGYTGLWYILLDKLTVKNYLFALISSLNARKSGQGLGSTFSHGVLSDTKRRRTGDVNVTVVEDVFVDVDHELGSGSVPLSEYSRQLRSPVQVQFTSSPGRGGRGADPDIKTWGATPGLV